MFRSVDLSLVGAPCSAVINPSVPPSHSSHSSLSHFPSTPVVAVQASIAAATRLRRHGSSAEEETQRPLCLVQQAGRLQRRRPLLPEESPRSRPLRCRPPGSPCRLQKREGQGQEGTRLSDEPGHHLKIYHYHFPPSKFIGAVSTDSQHVCEPLVLNPVGWLMQCG